MYIDEPFITSPLPIYKNVSFYELVMSGKYFELNYLELKRLASGSA